MTHKITATEARKTLTSIIGKYDNVFVQAVKLVAARAKKHAEQVLKVAAFLRKHDDLKHLQLTIRQSERAARILLAAYPA